METDKMRIEIWSDVMCPFCYIGKRRFEKALEQFPERNQLQIEWKSFQLAPDLETDTTIDIHHYLAERKGMSLQQAKEMNRQVAQMAAEAGLEYHLDRAVVANSFDAHRFAHFAKKHNKQDQAEEMLFEAYFTDGKNIDDHGVLIGLGTQIGLDPDLLSAALEANDYANDVKADIAQAKELGVRGVPFFVFDRKTAVSGAQETAVFLQAIVASFAGWQKERPTGAPEHLGGVCTPDGCD